MSAPEAGRPLRAGRPRLPRRQRDGGDRARRRRPRGASRRGRRARRAVRGGEVDPPHAAGRPRPADVGSRRGRGPGPRRPVRARAAAPPGHLARRRPAEPGPQPAAVRERAGATSPSRNGPQRGVGTGRRVGGRARCSSASAWAPSPTGRRGTCPAGSSSGWRSPSRSPATRRCCSRTNPPASSTAATGEIVLELMLQARDERGTALVVVTHDHEVSRRLDVEHTILDGRLT